jgi:Ser/Thr protein kinase RdoA (MazF antagonist)
MNDVQVLDLLMSVAAAYGLGSASFEQNIATWGDHVRWRIVDSTGNKYLLKERDPILQSHEFHLHLDLHQFLMRNGGPVVPIMSCINGDLYTSWRGRQFGLQTWISGLRRLSVSNPGDLVAWGELLARFLVAASGFSSKGAESFDYPASRATYCPQRWFEVMGRISSIRLAIGDNNQGGMNNVERIVNWVRRHGDALEGAVLPQQFIHCDCLYNNCLVDENGMLFIVDLETAAWGYRITDIAAALAFAGGIVVTDEDSVSGIPGETLNHSAMQRVFDGFSSKTMLTPIERQSFHSLIGLRLVSHFVSCLGLDNPSVPPPIEVLPDALDRLVYLLGQLEQCPSHDS